jgi:hypothetical protein
MTMLVPYISSPISVWHQSIRSLSPLVSETNPEGNAEEMSRGESRHIDASQFELATVLSLSVQNEPQFKYMIPDEQARHMVLPWFFRSVAIPLTRLCGQVLSTEAMDGGALWISPGCPFSFERMLRSEMPALPIKLGWAGVKRCLKVGAQLDWVRHRLTRGRHWYLMGFGVEPSKESEAVRGALIEPVLAQADSDALPCYVETFLERTLPFYEAHGFRVEGAGNIPDGGPNFWAMIRTPRQ